MITRFAPSPTGPLHLGHAWSAMLAHDMARAESGAFLLRIEDIDRARCKPEWEAQLKDDLRWLGIRWDAEPMRQFDRLPAYVEALATLRDRSLLFDCTCTRADIAAALSAPQEGAPGASGVGGPDGPVYPGTCKRRDGGSEHHDAEHRSDAARRLDIGRAMLDLDHRAGGGRGLTFRETGPVHGPRDVRTAREAYLSEIGDVVLARRDLGTSYHLSVVIDDAAQGVTHVVRGADLFEATPIHVLLQRLLGLPTPTYHHHDLVRDAAGKRLAKRDDARSIASYRSAGWSAETLLAHLRKSRTAP